MSNPSEETGIQELMDMVSRPRRERAIEIIKGKPPATSSPAERAAVATTAGIVGIIKEAAPWAGSGADGLNVEADFEHRDANGSTTIAKVRVRMHR